MINRNNHTLLAWLILVSSIIYVGQTWLSLPPSMRIISLSSLYIGSFCLTAIYSSRSLFVLKRDDGGLINPVLIPISFRELLLRDTRFRVIMGLVGFLAVTYMVTTAIACFRIATVNEIYSFITGWTIICLLYDSQVKSHMLKLLFEDLQKGEPKGASRPAAGLAKRG